MKKAVFLDRDGTLIEDRGFVHRIEDLQFLPGVIDGLRRLQKRFLLFIITDQSGIERGIYTVDDYRRFHGFFIDQLKSKGIGIERTYFCPHVSGCDCKKPSTKHIEEATGLYGIESTESWAVGDHPSDIIMGKNAGCKTVYLLTGHGTKHLKELEEKHVKPTIITGNFLLAVEYVIQHDDNAMTANKFAE